MSDYIEGKRAVVEAFAAHVPIMSVSIAQGVHEDALLQRIKKCAKNAKVSVKTIPREKMDDISVRGSHQGVMAKVSPFEYASLNSIIQAQPARVQDVFAPPTRAQGTSAQVAASAQTATTAPHAHTTDSAVRPQTQSALVVLLDHITDAGNLGAIIRSADAVGASGVVIPNKRSAQVNASTYKTSAGAVMHMPVAQVANIANAIKALKDAGFWVAGASEQKSSVIWSANLQGKIALVFGNEEKGISRLVQRECDFFVSLPMKGEVASLNVAQASSVCMYEWLRQNESN